MSLALRPVVYYSEAMKSPKPSDIEAALRDAVRQANRYDPERVPDGGVVPRAAKPRVLNEVQREKMRDRADRQAVRRSNAVKLAKALQIDPELPIYMPAGVIIYHGRICHVDCQP